MCIQIRRDARVCSPCEREGHAKALAWPLLDICRSQTMSKASVLVEDQEIEEKRIRKVDKILYLRLSWKGPLGVAEG